MGGLFQITLFTYSQQGRKSDPQTPDFGEVFGLKIVPRSRKSGFEIYEKSSRCSIRFFIDLGSSPRAAPKLIIFHKILLLASLLGHLGAKRVPKVLQDSSRGRFFKNLVSFWGRFWKKFQRFPNAFSIQLPRECRI